MCPANMVSTDEKKQDSSIKKQQQQPLQIINLDQGDPTMFVEYWKKAGEKSNIMIPGWHNLSYFPNNNGGNVCWFLEKEFSDEVKKLHESVGNAITKDRYIVVGTGSTQLYQAALFALTSTDDNDDDSSSKPMDVVSAVPYYSSYPAVTDLLKSRLYKWGGDAYKFEDKNEPYIEIVCSPNNPDGHTMEPVVNGNGGKLIYDLAYYWPQYTPITKPADHDIMLFTVSKSTGHAGTRVGWAIVKDEKIARKMTKFIELSTIGVSKDSQYRAATIMRAVTESGQSISLQLAGNFFEFGKTIMIDRWERLRKVAAENGVFSLPKYPKQYCNYFGEIREAHPGFAWLKCNLENVEDCESLIKGNLKILVRGGKNFGMDNKKYVRISLLDQEDKFQILLDRLATVSSASTKIKA
ncbi:hypothetical protein C5167_012501 [Papaver somniferum]|uniref:Alliinase C-terminal domain-containing protein n=1 Tax=Papaver somniferum TaxID=3469 RepID=A0A4Y7IYG0_PAPSO|nr:tryptophan aminotransferase-related protein 1-like [Papaver somniferum]RZC53647.1 hypothetical protein C5167_012501 [Papaver somniferum]